MKLLEDLLPVFNKHLITLVESKQEADDVYTFVFESFEKINWKAGQHGILSFGKPKLEGGSWRGFSIASDPKEGLVRISTIIPEQPSEYKKALKAMKPGDSITMRGPFGPFYISEGDKPAVFIAGGIGITPYRSIIASCVDESPVSGPKLDLIYVDSKAKFTYKDDLDKLAGKSERLNISYLNNREALSQQLQATSKKYGNTANYYISGSQTMVKELKDKLISFGINKKNIINEIFLGLK